nr:Dabb family protein [Paraburkholderia hospita]
MCVLHALRVDRDARSTAKVNVLIRHIVMWKLNEGEGRTREQNASVLKQKLEACRDAVPGIVHLEVGIATPGLDSTYDVVLVSDFTDKAALDAYQVHPAHQDVKAFLAPIREARQAVDYEL